MDYYDGDINVIHLKFGDMRKHTNFTEEFSAKHPNFVKEYFKYMDGEQSLFNDPLEIVNYVEMYGLDIHFYFNMSDTPAKDLDDVRAYLNREHIANTYDYMREHDIAETTHFSGIDGEPRVQK